MDQDHSPLLPTAMEWDSDGELCPEDFHRLLFYIIVAVCLFVLALLVWIVIRYRAGANAVPSKVHHNTLLEVAWTLIPVIILVVTSRPGPKSDVERWDA